MWISQIIMGVFLLIIQIHQVLAQDQTQPQTQSDLQSSKHNIRKYRGPNLVYKHKPQPLPKALLTTPIIFLKIHGGHFKISDQQTLEIPTFCMSKTEITVAQYRKCVQEQICTPPDIGPKCYYHQIGFEQHPINCINWQQARTFSKWVGGDLPSEAQWEYAAKNGGLQVKYPWGNEEASCLKAVMNENGAGCGQGKAFAVCQTKGNSAQGLCDLLGNVSEWLLDEYQPRKQWPSDGSAICQNESCDLGEWRVEKGGDYYFDVEELQVTTRSKTHRDAQQEQLGFRVKKDCHSYGN